jgi:hypothetical protein
VAIKYIWIGPFGPYPYDDTTPVVDTLGILPVGTTQQGAVGNGQIKLTQSPTDGAEIVRLDDLDGRVFAAVEVADIDSPDAELNTITSVVGGMVWAYQVNAGLNYWTAYTFDSSVAAGVDSPWVVAGSSGYWIAVGGRYSVESSTLYLYKNWRLRVDGATLYTEYFDGAIWQMVESKSYP